MRTDTEILDYLQESVLRHSSQYGYDVQIGRVLMTLNEKTCKAHSIRELLDWAIDNDERRLANEVARTLRS